MTLKSHSYIVCSVEYLEKEHPTPSMKSQAPAEMWVSRRWHGSLPPLFHQHNWFTRIQSCSILTEQGSKPVSRLQSLNWRTQSEQFNSPWKFSYLTWHPDCNKFACSGGSFFPSFANFVKAAAGSPEEAEARGKMEAELQAISDYLSKEVRNWE